MFFLIVLPIAFRSDIGLPGGSADGAGGFPVGSADGSAPPPEPR